MTYQAPVDDIAHALKTAAGLDDLLQRGLYRGLDAETIGVVFYDIDANQPGGPGLFFLRIPLAKLAVAGEESRSSERP